MSYQKLKVVEDDKEEILTFP